MKLEDITRAKFAILLEGQRFHKLNKKYKVYHPAHRIANCGFGAFEVIDSGTSEADGNTHVAFGYDWDTVLADIEDSGDVTDDQWDSLTSCTTFDWFVLQEPKSDWYRWIVFVPENWK